MIIIANISKPIILADGEDTTIITFSFDLDIPFPTMFEIEVDGEIKAINQNPFSFKTTIAGERIIKTKLHNVVNETISIKAVDTPQSEVVVESKDKNIKLLEDKNKKIQDILDQLIIDSLMGGA